MQTRCRPEFSGALTRAHAERRGAERDKTIRSVGMQSGAPGCARFGARSGPEKKDAKRLI